MCDWRNLRAKSILGLSRRSSLSSLKASPSMSMCPDIACDVLEGANVFRQARAAECATRPQIVRRDVELRVRDENLMNSGRANTKFIANATNFVGKGNLHRVKRVIHE